MKMLARDDDDALEMFARFLSRHNDSDKDIKCQYLKNIPPRFLLKGQDQDVGKMNC